MLIRRRIRAFFAVRIVSQLAHRPVPDYCSQLSFRQSYFFQAIASWLIIAEPIA